MMNDKTGTIAVVIPAYEPDDRLPAFLRELSERGIGPIVLVNDGSGEDCGTVFAEAASYVEKSGGVLLTHEVNRGKGCALKTAFSYLLEHDEDLTGVITADADGQHSVEDIGKVRKAMTAHPGTLVLGVRNFDGDDVPWKSRFGNKLTEALFAYVSGLHVTDTQTGLRGIPKGFLRELTAVEGERFEYEMRMLLAAAGHCPITEVPIETIYDSKEDHRTHFDPIRDSIRIYRILGERFFRFLFSSLASCVLDLILFSVFCFLLKGRFPVFYAGIATAAARILSASANYLINYRLVFASRENRGKAGMRYALLAAAQMGLSALAITGLLRLMPGGPELVFKIVIDTILFLISYKIQQKYVF